MATRPDGSGQKGVHVGERQQYGRADDLLLIRLREQGLSVAECARRMGRRFSSVENRISRLVARGLMQRTGVTRTDAPAPFEPLPHVPVSEQKRFAVTDAGQHAELTTTVHEPIRTLADLITTCEIDTDTWDVKDWEAVTWESAAKDDAGVLQARTLYRVKARLTRKTGLGAADAVAAMVEGAIAARGPLLRITRVRRRREPNAQLVVIADPHFGKLCWGRGTGGPDYDVDIAYRTLVEGAASLIRRSGPVEKRYIVSLGDFFHFDTLGGTTTGGTVVDRDSRIPKILEVGTEALARIVRGSARTADTELVIVPGNHDEVLSAALQRIMVAEFRGVGAVQIDDTHTRLKATEYGANLLAYNHGDKRKKELCAALSVQHPEAWGRTRYREVHTGHLHSEGERYEGTITHAGVTMRTHRSITPPDQWHADELYVGAPRGMSAWTYARAGGLVAMHMFTPDVEARAA